MSGGGVIMSTPAGGQACAAPASRLRRVGEPRNSYHMAARIAQPSSTSIQGEPTVTGREIMTRPCFMLLSKT